MSVFVAFLLCLCLLATCSFKMKHQSCKVVDTVYT